MPVPFHLRQRFRLLKTPPGGVPEEEIIHSIGAVARGLRRSPAYLKQRISTDGFYECRVLDPDGTWYVVRVERIDRLY